LGVGVWRIERGFAVVGYARMARVRIYVDLKVSLDSIATVDLRLLTAKKTFMSAI
jgi:hypothetical protein